MLNRRLIRIRAMQALYAYEQAKGANFLLALDHINEAFEPDLNSVEKQDRKKLEGLSKLGQQIFQEAYSLNPSNEEFDAPKEVQRQVTLAKDYYKSKNRKDLDQYTTQSLIDAEKVYDFYLQFLLLLVVLANKNENDTKSESPSGLHKNKIIAALKSDKTLEYQWLKRNITWDGDEVFINKLYREAIKSNSKVLEYSAIMNHSLEEDLAIIKYLIKNVFLKHEVANDFFALQNIYWSDDKDLLRSMITHTVQDYPENSSLKIETLDDVWAESKQFLKVLFADTVTNDDTLMEYLLPKLKNWEFERISEIDKVLIKMGLTEMINFPQIPIKVTINEVIEISKNFSTPKSGQFINGLLDTISKELVDKGIIKKTGRGMLDNK
jgi:transcription antitermination protein NusB